MADKQEQPQPEQKTYKKSVTLRFADLEVCIETEDNHDLVDLNILAMQDLSIMAKSRVDPALFEEESDEDIETPDTSKTLMATPEPQKLEVRGMYQ